MPQSSYLVAAQQFMTRELISYEDELFSALYHDIGDFASAQTTKIVSQKRRTSIYGSRGVGKTAAMQGVLFQALTSSKEVEIMPITVKVRGARAASNIKELEDAFYRSVLSGILEVSEFKRKEKRLKEGTKKYAPWVAGKMMEAFSLVFPPLALASGAAEKGTKWLVGKLNKPDIESILASTLTDAKHATDILLSHLEKSGTFPVFVIDELDKVNSDVILSDFFDGNQLWFQGKPGIISLTYTFGESIKLAAVSSAKRVSTVEMYTGVTRLEDAETIIHSRAFQGISQICPTEKAAIEMTRELLPSDTIKAVLNVSAPNTFQMLEKTYEAIQKAINSASKTVTPEHVLEEETEAENPTALEHEIMKELSKGRLTPSDLGDRLDRKQPSIVRTLKEMMKKNWVLRVGIGKRAYYSLTMHGDSAMRRYQNKPTQ